MIDRLRGSHLSTSNGVEIETYIQGDGPAFVILPSYGRDGGEDYDDIASRLVADGWKVLRPQPRGVAGSKGPMSSLTLHDLADDVARSIRELSSQPVVMLGHAFGNVLARVVTTDHPELVKAVVLAAAEVSVVPKEVSRTPFIAGDPDRSEAERLDALSRAFFAPGHDPRIWLSGWYSATLKMQRQAVEASDLNASSACGAVPLLQVVPDLDPFIPQEHRDELKDQLGDRVTQSVIGNASHALFPEQPSAVADAVLPWAARHRP